MGNTLIRSIKKVDVQVQNMIAKKKPAKQGFLDVCFKWAPFAIIVAANKRKLKTTNNFKQQLLQILLAEAILNAAVLPLKKTVDRVRPNGEKKSFPSGHTATSFLGSTVLHHQLKGYSNTIKNSGFTLSVATAILRLRHNKHWFSDVVTGAIIGLASAKAASKIIKP